MFVQHPRASRLIASGAAIYSGNESFFFAKHEVSDLQRRFRRSFAKLLFRKASSSAVIHSGIKRPNLTKREVSDLQRRFRRSFAKLLFRKASES